MAGLPKFEEKINNLVSSAVQKSNPVLKGLIIKSYYREGTSEILLDVAVTGGDGGLMQQLTGVQFMRTWGMQPALPPIGATTLMITDGDLRNGTYAVAVFETATTNGKTTDNETPDTPPKVLLS